MHPPPLFMQTLQDVNSLQGNMWWPLVFLCASNLTTEHAGCICGLRPPQRPRRFLFQEASRRSVSVFPMRLVGWLLIAQAQTHLAMILKKEPAGKWLVDIKPVNVHQRVPNITK